MNCWHCGTQLIWGADFSYEDYGLEGEGIISTFSCPKCPATAEVFLPIEEENTNKGGKEHEYGK